MCIRDRVSVVDCAVLVAFPVMVAGLNEQVDPLGRPVHMKVTTPVKPSDENTARDTVPLCPAFRDNLVGFAEREKSSPPLTPVSYTHLDVYKRQG